MTLAEQLNYALVVLTMVLVAVTAAYAYVTFRILKANEAVVTEMREERFAATRPYVVAAPYVRQGAQLLYLSIQNSGRSPAERLTLRLQPDFHQATGNEPVRNIGGFSAFNEEIESLAPGSRLIFLLGVGHVLFGTPNDRSPLTFNVTARYSFGGRSFEEQTAVDLRPFAFSDIPHDPVAEELEKLRKSVDGISKAANDVGRFLLKNQSS